MGAKLGSPTRVAVLTYNIYHGEDANGDSNLDAVAKIINLLEPDLVALQEVDKKTTRVKGLDLTAELSKRTGMKGVRRFAKRSSSASYSPAPTPTRLGSLFSATACSRTSVCE
jgi:endonuclease/exonuclease/phosphatase family metal-dependent hydrolase